MVRLASILVSPLPRPFQSLEHGAAVWFLVRTMVLLGMTSACYSDRSGPIPATGSSRQAASNPASTPSTSDVHPTRGLPSPSAVPPSRLFQGASSYKYVGLLPKGYGVEPKRWPTLVFLHGRTDREVLAELPGWGPMQYGREHGEDFPFIVLAPTSADHWNPRRLAVFLDQMETILAIDRDRVYLTGHSRGGHGTWEFACAYPHRFAAIAPISGWGNPYDARRKLKEMPVWVYHGLKDDVVPVKESMLMIGALKEIGAEVKYTVDPEEKHGSGPTYTTPDLYQWFLQHAKKNQQGGSSATVRPPKGERKTDSIPVLQL